MLVRVVEESLAQSLEPNDDLTSWTLTLRKGITFGSGNPVDATAVEFSVDLHRVEGTLSSMVSQASYIDEIEIVDDLTVIFHLTTSWGGFPSLLATPVGMVVDPAVFDELGAEAFGQNPGAGGAGAFEVDHFARGEDLILTAKDDYWGGDVCLDTLRFVLIDAETRTDAMLNDELDAAMFRSATSIAELREAGLDSHGYINFGGVELLINHGAQGVERPGGDLRVRLAMAHALDPVVIDQRVSGGVGIPATALVTEDAALWSEGLSGLPYDPELATSLLDEAKADGYDGTLELVCENTPDAIEWAITVEAMLEAVGFDVTVENSMSIADKVALYREADYEIMCFSISFDETRPWASLLRTVQEPSGPSARIGYSNADMDAAMDGLRDARTVEERRVALAEIQAVWNETVPAIPTTHLEFGVFWQDNVEGLVHGSEALVFFDNARIIG